MFPDCLRDPLRINTNAPVPYICYKTKHGIFWVKCEKVFSNKCYKLKICLFLEADGVVF